MDKLIIVIGSAERKNEKQNPFSGAERKRMLEAYLNEEGVDMGRIRIFVLPDPDMPFDKGTRHIMDSVPKFDVIISTHELREQMTEIKEKMEKAVSDEAARRKVRIIRFRRTGPISATKVRDAMANGKSWEHMTGRSVARIIRQIGGVGRIKKICKTGKPI